MKQVILIIRADMATFLSVPLDEAEANQYVERWMEGKLDPTFGGKLADGRRWAFSTEKVALMHVESLESVQAQQMAQQAKQAAQPTRWGLSGQY